MEYQNYNSSALAKQVSDKMKLSQEEDLELYNELSQLGNGPVKKILDTLTKPSPMRRFVACIKGSCVRDAQYSKFDGAEPLDDDNWLDASDDTEIYINIVEAETEIRAKQIAATWMCTDPSAIVLHEI